jgi:hypothetical protein
MGKVVFPDTSFNPQLRVEAGIGACQGKKLLPLKPNS